MNFSRHHIYCRRSPSQRCFPGNGSWPLFLFAILSAVVLFLFLDYSQASDGTSTNQAGAFPTVPPVTSKNSSGSPTEAATASADETNHVNVLDDSYHLAIGDQLSYRVVEDEDDPKILPVTDSGELEVPYLGRYPAVGKTCKDLAGELKSELERKYYWQATVIIAVDSKPRSRGKIYLAGAVAAPGPQDISGDEVLTVSKAILRAGGLTTVADGNDVKVTRGEGRKGAADKTFIVNVTSIIEKGKTDNDITLQPGDFIYVPDRMIRF